MLSTIFTTLAAHPQFNPENEKDLLGSQETAAYSAPPAGGTALVLRSEATSQSSKGRKDRQIGAENASDPVN